MASRPGSKFVQVLPVALAALTVASAAVQVFLPASQKTTLILTAVLTVFAALITLFALRVLAVNPTTLTISLLGFPRTGKSVYLTALFDELQQSTESVIRFSPYGSETVEEVARNLNMLSKGVWLPPTKPGSVFFYRANATIGAGLFQKKYKIEIADYAGESMGELNPSHEKWLHRTDYFKYVIQSDAVILAIDSGVLLFGSTEEIDEMQNAFVAAFQILAEHKGALHGRKLDIPVALLFLKTDLAFEDPGAGDFEEQLTNPIDRLIKVCRSRCRSFKYFFVSSVGSVGPKGAPPKHLRPFNVVQPLVWLLRGTRRM